MTRGDRLVDWWERRKPRERLLLIAVVALTVPLAGYVSILKPVRVQIADSTQRLQGARSELAKLQQLVEERDRTGSDQLRTRQADLEARATLAESQIQQARIDLVTPQDMAPQLSAILQKFPQLRVVGIVSESPVPVDRAMDANSAKTATGNDGSGSMLYEHGLEVTVEGKYLDLIAYLEQLEHTPHQIYWQDLDLKVNAQGLPSTRIRFFTLSRGPTWLAL